MGLVLKSLIALFLNSSSWVGLHHAFGLKYHHVIGSKGAEARGAVTCLHEGTLESHLLVPVDFINLEI
jgi:hypothetical protein